MFDHFRRAQSPVFDTALAELRTGRKRSHWMWFIFPQIEGLGFSAMSQRYALHSLEEARAYLADPVLGERLRACTRAMLQNTDRTAHEILGSPDDMKFHSSITLFHRAAPHEALFAEALAAFFDGIEDSETLRRI